MTSYIYDGVCVLLIISMFSYYWRKGFISSTMSLLGTVGSAAAGYLICKNFAVDIYEKYVYDWLLVKVEENVASFKDGLTGNMNSGIISALLQNVANNSIDNHAAAEALLAGKLGDIALIAVNVIIFILVFIIVFFIINLLIKLFQNLNQVPVLGTLNKILGGVFGVALACIIIMAAAWVLNFLTKFYTADWLGIDIFESTFVFSVFYHLNPFIK